MSNKEVQSVYRTENKYLLSYEQAYLLKKQLTEVLPLDEHSVYGNYMVRSLYFDSVYNHDYNTKESGDCNRKKIRLRIYSYQDQFAKLEVKYKFNNSQNKKSLTISKEDALALMRGDYFVLHKYAQKNEFALEVFEMMSSKGYRPACLIEYDRYALALNEFNTRITFDSRIRSSETDLRLFEEHPLYSEELLPGIVLEVKFNQHLMGYVSTLLETYNLNQIAISKYCLGRRLLEEFYL